MTTKEALKFVEYMDIALALDVDSAEIKKEILQSIKEVAETQIPCKLAPKSSNKSEVPVCGKCNSIMDLMQGELNYCPNCGQKIDWSNDNG